MPCPLQHGDEASWIESSLELESGKSNLWHSLKPDSVPIYGLPFKRSTTSLNSPTQVLINALLKNCSNRFALSSSKDRRARKPLPSLNFGQAITLSEQKSGESARSPPAVLESY